MKKNFSIIFLLTFFSLSINVFAQPGAIDTTFNSIDIGFDNGCGASFDVFTTCIQSDGKIIIGGYFSFYNGIARNHIARLNVDGTLDTTFNPGTGANNTIYTTSIQNDGKIIIGGVFTTYNGITRNSIARLNANGSLDTTFTPTSGANGWIYSISIQSDGKIIVGGDFTSYNGIARKNIARINTNGLLDNTFNPGTGTNQKIRTTSLQNDGKIIISGEFTSYNGITRNCIARVNANGSIDTTFNPGTGANSNVYTTSIQSDGKIIIGGLFDSFNGITRKCIARINVDGSLDTLFNSGTGANSIVYTSSIQSDGKIIIGGTFTLYNGIARNSMARIKLDGSLDTTFIPSTGYIDGYADAIRTSSIKSDGKIIIGGEFMYNSYLGNLSPGHIACHNSDGTLDTLFCLGTGASENIYTTSIQTDGKIIIGGRFTFFNGVLKNRIARLNENGSLDTTFNSGTGVGGTSVTVTYISTISIQNDGKIIIGGSFTSFNGITSNCIARLNANGLLDQTFNTGTGVIGNINSTSIQSDGKIIIGGNFNYYNGIARNRIARINANGSLDTTFNPGTGLYQEILTTSIQSDGKIIIGGYFTSYNGIARNRIARLNSNGSLDTTFNPGSGANSTIYSTSIQSDGKIIIGGDFTSFNGTNKKSIARLNTNGLLDTTFNIGTGASSSFTTRTRTTSIQNDGKIIIGGYFDSYDGFSRNCIARLNVNGSLDTTFKPGTGTNTSDIYTTSIQNDGKIIIGGAFRGYNNIGRNRIARIYGGELDTITTTPFGPIEYCAGSSFSVSYVVTIPFLANNIFTAQLSDASGSFASPTTIGSLSSTSNGTINVTIPAGQSSGSGYRIRVVSSNPNIIGTDNRSNITVNTNLPESAGTITELTTVCQGQSGVTYTVPVIANATSYNWTLPIGASGTSTTNSITVNYSNYASSGDITVKGHNSCGDGATSTLAITVNSAATSAGVITGAVAVCQGQNAVTYTVPTIANATSYLWTLPSGVTGTSTTNSITVDFGASATSSNISVKGTNSCGDGTVSTLPITVNSLPASAGTISGYATVCQGQSDVTYTIPTIANATSYIWILPTGATGVSTSNSITVDFNNSASSGDITVKGHNSCGDGSTSTLAITVSTNVPVAAETISGSTTVCQGQNTVVYTVPTIANATSYVWTLPSGATGTSSTNSITANFGTSATSGNITVKGTNVCGDGAAFTLPITVNLLPVSAGVISGNATVCQGQNTVNYTVPEIANAVSYEWTLPYGATGTSTTNSITVDFGVSATSGNITVKGTNSCGDGSISTFPITVNVKPNTPIISLDGPVLHSNIISGNQWYNQNGLINGAINQNYSVTANGEYYVIVTTNGCSSDVSNTIQITNTSIEFIENKILSVYPNPVSNELIIEMNGNTEKLNFEVLNSIGQVVFKGNLVEKTTVQTSNFAPGVYLIKLENGKTFEFKKIIKE